MTIKAKQIAQKKEKLQGFETNSKLMPIFNTS